MPLTIAAVVLNYNGARLLPDCLNSLAHQSRALDEIVVVDNGSIDDSEAIVRGSGYCWLPLHANRGLGVGYNRGVTATSADRVFVLNEDMRLEPICIELLNEALDRVGPQGFSADPLQLDWLGERIIHYQQVLVSARSARQRLGATFSWPPAAPSFVPSDTCVDIPWSSAGCMLIDREKFDELGGFDETFFLDFEDVDLCWRAWLRGWRSVFVPSARLYHHWGASMSAEHRKDDPVLLAQLPRLRYRRLVSQRQNHQRFSLKTQPAGAIMLFLTSQVATVLACVALGKLEMARATIEALAWNFIHLRSTLFARSLALHPSVNNNHELVQRFLVRDREHALVWPADSGL